MVKSETLIHVKGVLQILTDESKDEDELPLSYEELYFEWALSQVNH